MAAASKIKSDPRSKDKQQLQSTGIPKGRRLRTCDAVAIPMSKVDDSLLGAVFKGQRCQLLQPVYPSSLSFLEVRKLESQDIEQNMPEPDKSRLCKPDHESLAPSEGSGLTREELEFIQNATGDLHSNTSSDSEGEMHVLDSCFSTGDRCIQVNGSIYHGLALGQMPGFVGMGVNRAFRSLRECKGRHAVILLGAGRFAACVFGVNGQVEEHKTFKRYVVRGKQGGAQSNHDKSRGKAKSVGACMRRDGEKRLSEDIKGLMSSWGDLLQTCAAVFVRCPPTMRSVLFGEWLEYKHPKVRSIPFACIGRPTLEACVTARSLLCSVLFFSSWPRGVNVDLIPRLPDAPLVKSLQPRAASKALQPALKLVPPVEELEDVG